MSSSTREYLPPAVSPSSICNCIFPLLTSSLPACLLSLCSLPAQTSFALCLAVLDLSFFLSIVLLPTKECDSGESPSDEVCRGLSSRRLPQFSRNLVAVLISSTRPELCLLFRHISSLTHCSATFTSPLTQCWDPILIHSLNTYSLVPRHLITRTTHSFFPWLPLINDSRPVTAQCQHSLRFVVSLTILPLMVSMNTNPLSLALLCLSLYALSKHTA